LNTLSRIREHYRKVYEREKNILLKVNYIKLNKALKIAFLIFVTLNILDIFTTLLNLTYISGCFEKNPLFSPLLNSGPQYFFIAIIIKFTVMIPLAIGIVIPIKPGSKHEVTCRITKLGFFIAILIVIPFYIWAIFFNNFVTLLSHFAF
jgi:hypothetical protein